MDYSEGSDLAHHSAHSVYLLLGYDVVETLK